MRAPRNTSRETKESPEGFLLEGMIAGPSGAIEAQEARGQADFTASDTLPTDYSQTTHDVRAVLEAAGLRFGEAVEGDPLFQYVVLPKGWRKQPTEHSMWSDLLDDKGCKRASILYKAAFYDRRAHIHLCCRYRLQANYPAVDTGGEFTAQAMDGDKVLFTSDAVEYLPIGSGRLGCDATGPAEKQIVAWFDEHYPDWQDPTAYWDQPNEEEESGG